MTQKRILHLIPGMGGGGAERQLVYLCRGMTALGWDVHVGMIDQGANLGDLVEAGAHVHMLHAGSPHDPRLLPAALRLIRSLDPAIVQTWLLMMDVLGGAACRLAGTPWVLTQRHSPVESEGFKHRVRIRLARHAAAVISNSREGADFWRAVLPGQVKSAVIGNALPLEEIDAIAPAGGETSATGSAGGETNFGGHAGADSPAPGQKLILYVGRFEKQKNVPALVRALNSVLDEHNAGATETGTSRRLSTPVAPCTPGMVAYLVGEGDYRHEVEAVIDELGLRRKVILPGYRPKQEIWALMKRSDVFVSVSHFEGMPNTVMEAMACGCRLVISDIPQHRALVPEECALFVDQNDPQAIARGIQEAMKQTESPASRERARRVVEEMSITKMACRHEELYMDILRSVSS